MSRIEGKLEHMWEGLDGDTLGRCCFRCVSLSLLFQILMFTGKYTRGPQKLDTVYTLGYDMAQYIKSSTGWSYSTLYGKLTLAKRLNV